MKSKLLQQIKDEEAHSDVTWRVTDELPHNAGLLIVEDKHGFLMLLDTFFDKEDEEVWVNRPTGFECHVRWDEYRPNITAWAYVRVSL